VYHNFSWKELMSTLSTPLVCDYKAHVGPATIASRDVIRKLVQEAASAVGGHKFGQHFLLTEWEQVVDAWQLENWEAYRDVARLGRKTRLPEAQRAVLWSMFEGVRASLKARNLITHAGMFGALAVARAAARPRRRRVRPAIPARRKAHRAHTEALGRDPT
jgi:hypothetical protein